MYPRLSLAAAVLSLVLPFASNAYEACYWGNGEPLDFGGHYEIDVYTVSSFYDNAIGTSTWTDAEKEHVLRQNLSKYQSESGSLFHYYFRGLATGSDPTTCDADSPERTNPYFIVMVAECGANARACGNYKEKANGQYKCGIIKVDASYAASYERAGFLSDFNHELGHTLKMFHQNDPTNCPQNATDLCSVCSTSAGVAHLTRADRWYHRNDIGFLDHNLREIHGAGFPPASWSANVLNQGGVISAAAATDGDDDDSMSGYAWNVNAGGQSEVRAKFYEDAWTAVQVPSYNDSYYKPDVTRTSGIATERWLVAYLYNDSQSSIDRDILIAERNVGSGTWTESALDTNTPNPHIAAAYDPATDKFILLIERGTGLRFYVRARTGGSWYYTQTAIETFDGADLACSAHGGPNNYNCVITYVDTNLQGIIRWRRMRISGNGVEVGSANSGGVYGFSRPSVTANPNDADPQFVYAFSQAGTTVFIRKQNRNSDAWVGGTAVGAPSRNWLGPAGLGVFQSSSAETDIMINDD